MSHPHIFAYSINASTKPLMSVSSFIVKRFMTCFPLSELRYKSNSCLFILLLFNVLNFIKNVRYLFLLPLTSLFGD